MVKENGGVLKVKYRIVTAMRDPILMIKRMDLESTSGQVAMCTMVIMWMMKGVEKEQ